ncbi:MAG: exodeoxyribonuclease III [Rhodospirillales bacterium]
MTKIATFNVNSLRARLPNILEWLKESAPDIALLQEIKATEETFPRMEIEELGYNIEIVGQKSYNGVAIFSKQPIDVLHRALPGDDGDDQARYLEANIGDLIVATIYLPNGNPTDSPKFEYKLGWMDRLTAHARELLATESAFVLAGDYNICPQDEDCYSPERFANDALCRPESRARFRELCNLGLTNAVRSFHKGPHVYSYWDYQAGAWQKDNGLLIDHLLLSPQAADRLVAADIDRKPRGREKASDHTPVWCEIE